MIARRSAVQLDLSYFSIYSVLETVYSKPRERFLNIYDECKPYQPVQRTKNIVLFAITTDPSRGPEQKNS
jgi:hypothetical protein